MQILRRAFGFLGIGRAREDSKNPDYQALMNGTLARIRAAELQMQEAESLEELDVARSALQSAQAEMQQLIRSAKRDRGMPVRTIAENEEMHRNLRDFMNRFDQPDRTAPRRKTGTSR